MKCRVVIDLHADNTESVYVEIQVSTWLWFKEWCQVNEPIRGPADHFFSIRKPLRFANVEQAKTHIFELLRKETEALGKRVIKTTYVNYP